MKHFQNNEQRAAAYVAMKELERMLDDDGELPPGYSVDLSGVTVEIQLPNGTGVSREKGVTTAKGEGRILKTATQNLYGWAIIYNCFRVASKFKQHKVLQRVLMMIVRRALKHQISSEDAFAQLMPRQAKEIQALKDSMPVPKRDEPTPRKMIRDEKKFFPTIRIFNKRKAA